MTWYQRIREYYNKELRTLRENQALDIAIMLYHEMEGKYDLLNIPDEKRVPIPMFELCCKQVPDYIDWFIENRGKQRQKWTGHEYENIVDYVEDLIGKQWAN